HLPWHRHKPQRPDQHFVVDEGALGAAVAAPYVGPEDCAAGCRAAPGAVEMQVVRCTASTRRTCAVRRNIEPRGRYSRNGVDDLVWPAAAVIPPAHEYPAKS